LTSLADEKIAKTIMKHMVRGDDVRYEIYMYDEHTEPTLVESVSFLYPYHQQEAITFLYALDRYATYVKQSKKKIFIQ
jgi:hypothetical protein